MVEEEASFVSDNASSLKGFRHASMVSYSTL